MNMASPGSIIRGKLANANSFWFTVIAACTAFCLYTCVYAFRKTFSVATFDNIFYLGISYKVWLVTFQVIGYALSKFAGIKLIAELRAHYRTKGILWMIVVASVSWFFFAIVPPPYNLIFLFTNGFPLGLVWGMVFGYLEGRKTTEILGAALSVSFIFSGGFCRSVGSYILNDWHVSEFWMPFVACCLFAIPLLLFLMLIDLLPPPDLVDEEMRTKRQPMLRPERKEFITSFLPGVVLFVLAYTLLTIFREVRENFASDVWKSLGYESSSSIYTRTETPVSIIVLILIGSMMLIKKNHIALMINHVIIISGMILIGIATLLFELQMIDAPLWITLIGVGLYLGYVPFNSVFFDRLIATFKFAGTVGFIMYVADSFGYLGSISVLFFKEFAYASTSWVNFFIFSGYFVSITGSILIIGSLIYFQKKYKSWREAGGKFST